MHVKTSPRQIRIVNSEHAWLKNHAEYRGGQWYCKKTGAPIQMIEAFHSLWESDAPGPCAGSGQTVEVFHIYCPRCQRKPAFAFGSPIQEKELLDAENG